MAARPNQRTALCLTDLPEEIFLEILSRLDIRDAARTSAVCRAWRHLGTLVFNARSVGGADLASVAQSVLLRHFGHVRKFALVYSAPCLPATGGPRVDDLLDHISHPRHGLRILFLSAPSCRVHSSVFSCVTLVMLRLNGCLLPSPSPEFAGLPNLKDLLVHYNPILKPLMNSGQLEALGTLISGCPSLTKLDVIVAPDVPGLMLKVSAPRLRDLRI